MGREKQADARETASGGRTLTATMQSLWGGVEARAGMGRAWRESQALGGIRGGFRDRQEGNGKIRAETDRTLGLDSGSPGLELGRGSFVLRMG